MNHNTLYIVDDLYNQENTELDKSMKYFCEKNEKIKFLFLRSESRSSWMTDTEKLWGPDIESEYIIDILTNDGEFKNFQFLSLPKNYIFSKTLIKCDILAYSSNIYSMDFIDKLINRLQPKVLLHLSDERGIRPQFIKVFEKVKLVYRQYNYTNKRGFPDKPFIKYLPLGYHSWGKKYIRNNTLDIELRKYKWCFSGSIKNNRVSQIQQLSIVKPHFQGETLPFETTQMFQNSIFAFCPQGNSNIECSRMYEAMYNGCIPIILCPNKKTIEHFKNSFEIPLPCYFSLNIQDVINIIQNTSMEHKKAKQSECFLWLKNISESIRNNILFYLKN